MVGGTTLVATWHVLQRNYSLHSTLVCPGTAELGFGHQVNQHVTYVNMPPVLHLRICCEIPAFYYIVGTCLEMVCCGMRRYPLPTATCSGVDAIRLVRRAADAGGRCPEPGEAVEMGVTTCGAVMRSCGVTTSEILID